MRSLLPLLLLVVLTSACQTPAPGARAPGAAATSGLIRVGMDAGMFPRSWHRPAVGVLAVPLPAARATEARAWAAAALAKYPAGFAEQHLQRVYLLGGLHFRGVHAGGSNSRRRLYVVLPQGRGARAYFERVIHAEFSSVLLRRHRGLLDTSAWLRGTIPGFRYGASGAAAVRHGRDSAMPSGWALKQGFLYEYGMSSIENDVNSYAGFLFTHPEALQRFATQYPGVAHKRALIQRFYGALDPRFQFAP